MRGKKDGGDKLGFALAWRGGERDGPVQMKRRKENEREVGCTWLRFCFLLLVFKFKFHSNFWVSYLNSRFYFWFFYFICQLLIILFDQFAFEILKLGKYSNKVAKKLIALNNIEYASKFF